MGYTDTDDRGQSVVQGQTSALSHATWATRILFLSVLLLAVAPVFVATSYSILEHTISESGGQGVEHGWIMRAGTLLTAVAVFLLAESARPFWPFSGRLWMRMYALGLVFLVAFPESPWDGGSHNLTVAGLHTVAGVLSAASFILGAAAISRTRNRDRRVRMFDWIVIAAIAITPQIMLVVVEIDGLLQRSMVLLGYLWLLLESIRVADQLRFSGERAGQGDQRRIERPIEP